MTNERQATHGPVENLYTTVVSVGGYSSTALITRFVFCLYRH